MKTVNLNDRVTVRLTVFGLNKLTEQERNCDDEEGRFTCQLWELMNLFGEQMKMGFDRQVFERNELFFGE